MKKKKQNKTKLGKREKRKYNEKNKVQNTKILIGSPRPSWVSIGVAVL